jgi:hypothetical protein
MYQDYNPFENWHLFTDEIWPRLNQPVLVRTVHNEMFVMQCRHDETMKKYFELATYSPNFKFGRWYPDSLLQWHPIPGFE